MKEIILQHNTQWQDGGFETGIEREMLAKIRQALDVSHIIAVSGARRSGKSYLFRQVIRSLLDSGVNPSNIFQINLEDPYFLSFEAGAATLDSLVSEYFTLKNPKGRIFLFFDEIQNIRDWPVWMRKMYDRRKDVKMFITGSNSEMLSVELGARLTGRVLAFENFPFSFREFCAGLEEEMPPVPPLKADPAAVFNNLFPYRERLLHYLETGFTRGFFPETAFLDNLELVRDILSQYFQNVLFRDIVPRFSIRNVRELEQLAYYCSTNFTSSFSMRKLSVAMGVSENTIKEYIAFFEKAYLFFPVDYFEYSMKKRFRRNRKMYMIDNGVRHATSSSFSPDFGKCVENLVYLHLRRKGPGVYYWYEDKTYREMDFIVQRRAGKTAAINVTYTDEIDEKDFEAFRSLTDYLKSDSNILITRNTFETVRSGGIRIEMIPLWVFVWLDI